MDYHFSFETMRKFQHMFESKYLSGYTVKQYEKGCLTVYVINDSLVVGFELVPLVASESAIRLNAERFRAEIESNPFLAFPEAGGLLHARRENGSSGAKQKPAAMLDKSTGRVV